jgi:hypothetical protein
MRRKFRQKTKKIVAQCNPKSNLKKFRQLTAAHLIALWDKQDAPHQQKCLWCGRPTGNQAVSLKF